MDELSDELFCLPPSEFTAARDALAKRLRAEKRRDDAAKVKALRRPTVPAWAVNQVARRHPDVIEDLVAAGRALAAAQRRALSGVKDSGMRNAGQQRRDAVERAWRTAAQILADAGADPAAHRQPVADTFEAATADTQAAQTVGEGRLSKELPPPSGFGAVTGFSLVADDGKDDPGAAEAGHGTEPGERDADADAAAADAAQAAQAAQAARAARQRADEAAERADAAQRRSGDAQQAALRANEEAERLERRAAKARARADDLTARARAAEETAGAARGEAEKLAAAADAAQAAIQP